MATSLAAAAAAAAARRLAAHSRNPTLGGPEGVARFSQRRGFAGSADHHGPPRVNIWEDPLSPSKWKEEHFVIASLSFWGILIYGGYKMFSGGKKDEKEVKLAEASH